MAGDLKMTERAVLERTAAEVGVFGEEHPPIHGVWLTTLTSHDERRTPTRPRHAPRLLFAVFAFLAMSVPARSDDEVPRPNEKILRSFDLGLSWGTYQPDDPRLEYDDHVGLHFGYDRAIRSGMLGWQATVDRFETRDQETGRDWDAAFLDLSARYTRPVSDRLAFTVLAGPGWRWSNDAGDVAVGPAISDALDDSLSLHLGGGLDYRLNDRWRLYTEVRFRWFERDDFDRRDFGGTLGWSYRFGRPDRIAPPPFPVTLEALSPVAGDDGLYETHAAREAKEEPTYRIRLRAQLRNRGQIDQTLTRIDVRPQLHDGFSPPFKRADPTVTVSAGGAAMVMLPHFFGLTSAPRSLEVKLTFATGQTFTTTIDLSPAPLTYAFPARHGDAADEVYWVTKPSWHSTCGHNDFAYDLKAVRWDGAAWTLDTGETNADHAIWNLPVRAIADGTIVRCDNEHRENPRGERPPRCTNGGPQPCRTYDGGNHVEVQHANGDIARYWHLKKGSLPPDIWPACRDGSVTVREGTILGRVGNSGNSSNPHLHLEVQRGGYSQPIQFRTGHAVERTSFDGIDSPWVPLNAEGLARDMVVMPPGCGNGRRDAGELCDGADIGTTCRALGAGGGSPTCTASCNSYDRSSCDLPGCSGDRGDPGCDCLPIEASCLKEESCRPDGPGGPNLYCPDSFGDAGSVCALKRVDRGPRPRWVPICRTCPKVPLAPSLSEQAGYGCPCFTDADCRLNDVAFQTRVPLACWGSSENGWAAGPGVCLPQVDPGGFARGTPAEGELERVRWLCKSNCTALGEAANATYLCDSSFEYALCVEESCSPGECGATAECDPDGNFTRLIGNADCIDRGYPRGYLCTESGRCVPPACAPPVLGQDLSWCYQFAAGDPS